MIKSEHESIDWLKLKVAFGVLESEPQTNLVYLKLSPPTIAERIKAFMLFVRSIQGKLTKTDDEYFSLKHNRKIKRSTGDFVGGEYEDE